MSFNYNFRFAEDKKDIEKLEKFILPRAMNYPNFCNWFSRAREEIFFGVKKVIIASSEDFLVAYLIFQSHKDFPNSLLELKSMRVHEKMQARYFGAFMLKQAETEALGKYKGILCDTHSDNSPVTNLLRFMGYQELFRAPLYDRNTEEIIFGKLFEKTDRGIFIPVKKKILERSFN